MSDPSATRLVSGDRFRMGDKDLREGDAAPAPAAVQSFIAAVLQSDHLNLLVGAGFSRALVAAAVRLVPTGTGAAAVATGTAMTADVDTGDADLDNAIAQEADISARAAGRGGANLEDRLSAAISLERGLRMISDPRGARVADGIGRAMEGLINSVAADERAIAAVAPDSPGGPAALASGFLGVFASRLATRDRMHLFTTNYDRVLEWAADQAGLRVLDRFVGTLSPRFRASRLEVDYHYAPPGPLRDPRHLDGVIRFTKLHGSLDWAYTDGLIRVPTAFGQMGTGGTEKLVIYPQAAKDMETTHYPYAELFRDFAAAACRPETVLFTYGYSFGDAHVNRVIRDMLTLPSTHLVVINWADDGGRILSFTAGVRSRQVTLLLGPTFGDLQQLVSCWLPWTAAPAPTPATGATPSATPPGVL